MKPIVSIALNAAVAALWAALFIKHGFSIEAVLALVAFILINLVVYLLGRLTLLNLEFLKLSQAIYDQYKKTKETR